jgi:ferredoxin
VPRDAGGGGSPGGSGDIMGAEAKFRVRVEADRCQGHNRCCAIAPELFEADDLGFAHVRGDGRVAPALEDKARLAVRNCPEHAVRMSESG